MGKRYVKPAYLGGCTWVVLEKSVRREALDGGRLAVRPVVPSPREATSPDGKSPDDERDR